jgi:hypothetical protein
VDVSYYVYPTPKAGDPGKGNVVTDNTGAFEIKGHSGAKISFQLSKRGYRTASTNTGAVYSQLEPANTRYVPNHSSPQLIRMWKDRGAENLVSIDQVYQYEVGRPAVRIDLLAGRIVEGGGDMEITVKRESGSIYRGEQFDWTLVIRAIDGGVKTAASVHELEFAFEAPIDGYTERVEHSMAKGRSDWQPRISEPVYIVSRNGSIYSKFILTVSVTSETNVVVSTYSGVANRNASRNWESPSAHIVQP